MTTAEITLECVQRALRVCAVATGRAILVARDDSATAPRRAVINLVMPETPAPTFRQCDECECALSPMSHLGARLRFSAEPGKSGVAEFARKDCVYHEAIASDLNCADKYPDWRRLWQKPKEHEPRSRHEAGGYAPPFWHASQVMILSR